MPTLIGTQGLKLRRVPVVVASGGGDAAATTAFLVRTSGLDATHIAAYKALINGLVADGVFSKFDGLIVTATQDLVTARLNLVSSSFALVDAGITQSFVADRGTTGDSLSTQFTPSVNGLPGGGKYDLDSAHIMVWSNTAGNSTGGEFGTVVGSVALFTTNSAVTGSRSQVNSAADFVENTSSGYGFYLASRTASNNVNNYWGASGTLTTLSVSSTASTNLPNTEPLRINGVTGYAGSNKQISAASWGSQLSGTDVANYYSRLQAYMTAVGN